MSTPALPFTHAARRNGQISDLPSVVAELARLYHAARIDEVAPGKARALSSILTNIATIMTGVDVDRRIAALEHAVTQRRPPGRPHLLETMGEA